MKRKISGRGRPCHRRTTAVGLIHPTMSPFSGPIRVFVADGQEVVRVGLRAMLEGEPDLRVVGEAGTVAGILSETQRLKPDVLLLEYRLPDGSGAEACRMLLRTDSATHVLIMTLDHSTPAFRDAVEAGVHGYLHKNISRPELIRAIRTVAGGASYLDSEAVYQTFSTLRQKHDLSRRPGLHDLSPQQRRLLPLVAEGKTNKEIGATLALSDKTIKNYIRNMFAKLKISRRAQAASFYVQTERTGALTDASIVV